MEEKITAKLLIMGIFATLFAFIISSIVFSNNYEKQLKRDLDNRAELLSELYNSTNDYAALIKYADKSVNIAIIKDNKLFAASTQYSDKLYMNEEINLANTNGKGSVEYSTDNLFKKEYAVAIKLEDNSILRISCEESVMSIIIGEALPFIFLIIIVLIIISVIMAVFLTQKLLSPIKNMAKDIDNIELFEGAEKNIVYKELMPFIKAIQEQRAQIKYHMKAVDEEKNKVTTIIKNMSEGLIVLDMDMEVLMANESAKEYFDKNLLGKQAAQICDDSDFIKAVNKAMKGDNNSEFFVLNDKQVQMFANPVLSNDEQIGVVCILLDLTEKNKLERMRQEFTANVSHELKTPLTSISGYAEMIETGMARQADVSKFATIIHKESGRLLSLIGDTIKLMELDEVKKADLTEQIDLKNISEECIDILSLAAEKKNVTFEINGETSVIKGNSNMISELIYNLCDNAIRYNKDNGIVTVTIGKKSISVKDTGIGIPKKEQSRIFERFYRVDKSRSKETGGTGLGLAIVKHIAEQHDARIEVNSEIGLGTEIKVTFM